VVDWRCNWETGCACTGGIKGTSSMDIYLNPGHFEISNSRRIKKNRLYIKKEFESFHSYSTSVPHYDTLYFTE
jgi:hypothetical protein